MGDIAVLNEPYGGAAAGSRFRVAAVEPSRVGGSGDYIATLRHPHGERFGQVFVARLRRP